MLNPCINCKDNSSECIKCFEKEVLGHHAEIAELKDKLGKYEALSGLREAHIEALKDKFKKEVDNLIKDR